MTSRVLAAVVLYFLQKGCGKPVSALQRPAKLIFAAIVPCGGSHEGVQNFPPPPPPFQSQAVYGSFVRLQ